jgi:tripeptidyl-peptidase-1
LTGYQKNLDDFFEAFTNIPAGTSPIWMSVNGGQPPPTSPNDTTYKLIDGEASLDLQTSIPIVYPQNVTVWQNDDPYWVSK